jgi:hypothetical protein
LEETLKIQQWVSIGGDLDDNLVLLEVALAKRKPLSPFKLNPEWIKDEEFIRMHGDSSITHFMNIHVSNSTLI